MEPGTQPSDRRTRAKRGGALSADGSVLPGWVTVMVASGLTVHAQDALRSSLAGEEAAAARRRAVEHRVYNIQAGPVDLLLRTGLSAEYNSNVQYSRSGERDDVILRPMVWGDAYWPVSEVNSLDVSIGLGYAAYVRESQLSYVVVQPGSEVAFDVFSGDFRFRFYNRFEYTLDPSLNGAVSDTARFGGFKNVAGIDGVWDLNDVIARLGYGYEIFRSDVDQWSYLDRGTHLVSARADLILNDMFTVGPEGTVGVNAYDQQILSDSTSASGGGFVQARLSEYVRTSLHAGYVRYDFQTVGIPFQDPDVSTWYAQFRWRHRVNPWLTYTLSAGREVRLGIYSEYEEQWAARWTADWEFLRKTGLRTWVSYEDGEQPPQSYDRGTELVLLLGREYRRWGVGLEARREILARLQATVAYRFYDRTGRSGTGSDYTSHAVTLGGVYRL
jgi:hypothetical protein